MLRKPDPRSLAATFRDPESFGLSLLVALYAAYGSEPIGGGDTPEGWGPETIHQEVLDDFGADLKPAAFGRLMAALSLAREPAAIRLRVTDFMDLANALNGDSYAPGEVDPVSAAEAAWAIYESILIERLFFAASDDAEDELPEFSAEIRGYLGAVLDREGIVDPPDVLRIAEHDADRLPRVLNGWADDPQMFAAIADAAQARSADITAELKGRLSLLFAQLARLFRSDAGDVVAAFGLSNKNLFA